jgi:putative Holliday junction resolvase
LKRIAAIDYGETRIGLAISDPTQVLASPLKTLQAEQTPKSTAESIALVLGKHMPIEKIVIGLPLLMNGKEGKSSAKVRQLVLFLEEVTGLPIIFWDERLTTIQVERTLKEAGISRKKRTQYVDAMAAREILQNYLDSPHI